jgi:hypothetical protein
LVSSFGRPQKPEQVLPPLMLPAVQIPAMLAIDAASMAAVVDQIREQVARAVREGFAQAVGEYDPEAAAAFTEPDAPEPAPEQLADLSR